MPLPIELSTMLLGAVALGLAFGMFVAQAIGGAIGNLILRHRARLRAA